MKTINAPQGSPEWLAHRAGCFNASDAAAMLDCSPYETRAALLRRLHSGIAPEVDVGTQRRFDDGHRFEALARPLAEEIIGDDLAPVVGSTDSGLSRPFGASFDGLTLMGDTAFEHKSMGEPLRYDWEESNGDHLPKHYRAQMEQQLLVSGAERVLFMATKWTPSGELVEQKHCWYASDPQLRAELLAGWKQFDADLAAYVPPSPAQVEKIVAEPVEALPAPIVKVSGELSLQDNFKVFEQRLQDFLKNRLIREPKTDQDFADLDVQIKAMKAGREALKSAKAQMLAQVQPIDQASKTAEMLDSLLQQNVSMAEKLLTAEKERRKGEIVAGGVTALREHIVKLNERLGGPYMPAVAADFGGAVKGLKSLTSMEDKVAGVLAAAKIEANEIADRIQVNLDHLRDNAGEYRSLFPDAAQIVLKQPEDLRALVTARIAEAKGAEERRAAELAERERARIRQEEQDRLAREQREREEAAARAAAAQPSASPYPATQEQIHTPQPARSSVVPIASPRPATRDDGARMKLGDINAALAPLQLDAAGLAKLGFAPAATEKGAKLFRAADFPLICDAILALVQRAREPQAA